MHRQVSAERSKRAEILDSEGHRQSAINIAEGKKISVILASEAKKAEQINGAQGEAEAIRLKAEATAKGIDAVAKTLRENKAAGQGAVSLAIAEKYVDAFGKLAKEANSVIVPAQLGDLGGMIAGAMGIYGKISETQTRNQQQLGDRLEKGMQERLEEPKAKSEAEEPKAKSEAEEIVAELSEKYKGGL
jgi:regulator of protease activity HflC (stomatin/prohibitin superfamily)